MVQDEEKAKWDMNDVVYKSLKANETFTAQFGKVAREHKEQR